MGIREKLNQNPKAAAILVGALIIIAVSISVWTLSESAEDPGPTTRGFYSTDDGSTWFVADLSRGSSFEHEGKLAVLVRVFRCGNDKPFAGYLERYTEMGKKLQAEGKPALDILTTMGAREFKKPGGGADAKWLQPLSSGFAEVTQVTCPGGAELESVEPR